MMCSVETRFSFCGCVEPFDRSLDRLSMLPRRLGHEVGSKPAQNRARIKCS